MTNLVLGGNLITGSGSVATNEAGAVAGSLATVTEETGIVRKTVITFASRVLALTDVASTVAYVGSKVYDFPEGAIFILGAVADLTITKDAAGVDDAFNGDFGVGTVTASNNATLATTEQNIIPTTATPAASSGVTTGRGVSTAAVTLDGTTTPADVYLNILVDDGDQDVTSTPTNLLITGTLTLVWANLTDHAATA